MMTTSHVSINKCSVSDSEYSFVFLLASCEVFHIRFEVPCRNASCDLNVTSDISYAKFLVEVALKMETSITHLSQLGYVPSWKIPKTGKSIPKLLEKESDFENLVDIIWTYIEEQKGKNHGKGKVKPWTILIMDTSGPEDIKKVAIIPDLYIESESNG